MAYIPIDFSAKPSTSAKKSTGRGTYIPIDFNATPSADRKPLTFGASTKPAPVVQTPTKLDPRFTIEDTYNPQPPQKTASDLFNTPKITGKNDNPQPSGSSFTPFAVFGPNKQSKTVSEFFDGIAKAISFANPLTVKVAYSPSSEEDLLKLQKEYNKSRLGYYNRTAERVVSGLAAGASGGQVVPPVEPSLSKAEDIFGAVEGGVAGAIGAIGAISSISAGIESVLGKSATIASAITKYPTVARFAVPVIKNVAAFDIYGQLDPNTTDRIKKLASDTAAGILFSGAGFIKNVAVAGASVFGLGYGLSKMDGASDTDAAIQGAILVGLDLFGRAAGSAPGHTTLNEKVANDTLRKAAVETINRYSSTKITSDSSLDVIKKAYYEAANKVHPDKGGSQNVFSGVNNAYGFLTGKAKSFPPIGESISPKKVLLESRDTISDPIKSKTEDTRIIEAKQSVVNDYHNSVAQDAISVGKLAVIKTIEYPDGKFGFAYDINTVAGSNTSDFTSNPLSTSRAEAVRKAKEAVVAYAQDQLVNDPNSLAADQFATIARHVSRASNDAKTVVPVNGESTPQTPMNNETPADTLSRIVLSNGKFTSTREGVIRDRINGQLAPSGVDFRTNTLVIDPKVLKEDIDALMTGEPRISETGVTIQLKPGETRSQVTGRYLHELIRFEERHLELITPDQKEALGSEMKAVQEGTARMLDEQVIASFEKEIADKKEADEKADRMKAINENKAKEKAKRDAIYVLDKAKTGETIEVRSFAGMTDSGKDSGFRTVDPEKASIYASERNGTVREFTDTLKNPYVIKGSQIDVLSRLADDSVLGAKALQVRYHAEIVKNGGTSNTDPIVSEIDNFIKDQLKKDGYDSVVYQGLKEYQIFDTKKSVKIAPPRTATSLSEEITKRVEKFRKEAGIVAQREGAGVLLRTVEDGAGNVNFTTKDFNLNRAKSNMASQAASAKKYAQQLLYENDASFRELVDERDYLTLKEIEDAKTVAELDVIDETLTQEIETLSDNIVTYEENIAPAQQETLGEIARNQVETRSEAPRVAEKVTTKGSRVFERLQAEHPEELSGDLSYTKMNMQNDAEKAVNLIESDVKKAYRVAMEIESIEGQTATAVNIALADAALEDGNTQLYSQLVKQRSIAQTRRGQELVAEKGSISDNNTSRFVKELIKARMDKLGRGYTGKADTGVKKMTDTQKAVRRIDEEVEQAREKIKKNRNKRFDFEAAQKLIDSLACK